jgi:hypothetical protein
MDFHLDYWVLLNANSAAFNQRIFSPFCWPCQALAEIKKGKLIRFSENCVERVDGRLVSASLEITQIDTIILRSLSTRKERKTEDSASHCHEARANCNH